jgi:hypothetical protein
VLGQSNQFRDRSSGQFGGEGWPRFAQISRYERDAQEHRLLVGDQQRGATRLGGLNRVDGKPTPKEWVRRIGHFDLGRTFQRVLEGGSKVWARTRVPLGAGYDRFFSCVAALSEKRITSG